MSTTSGRTGWLAATGSLCLALGIVVLVVPSTAGSAPPPAASAPRSASVAADATSARIARSQQHLRQVPRDWQAWAGLGLDYVEQAKVTIDPTYYPKAAAALHRSLTLQRHDNIVAMAGEAGLAAARHDFRGALRWARRGLAADPQSALLHGALCDALTQLGHYRAAESAARRMELLRPGADAEARLSYAAELRGDVPAARSFMRLALRHAFEPAQVAFARYYLGELALSTGRPREAIRHYSAGLTADPTYVANLEGRAKALRALGHTNAALRTFAAVVLRVPQPSYVLEYGDLLDRLGRTADAEKQYAVFRAEEQLFRANGVTLDTDETLFEANHGDPQDAVAAGRAALRTRPFLESYDAYAWALHQVGRDHAALAAVNLALRTGVRTPLFHLHRRAIERALGRPGGTR